MHDATFAKARANKGGAIYWDALSYSLGILENCTFNDVSVSFISGYSNGGAIYIETENTEVFSLKMEYCSFDTIFAGNQGGLMYIAPLREDADVQMLHVSISDVYAPIGSVVS